MAGEMVGLVKLRGKADIRRTFPHKTAAGRLDPVIQSQELCVELDLARVAVRVV